MYGRDKMQLAIIKQYLLEPQSVLSMAMVRIALGLCVMWQALHKGLIVFSGTAQDGFVFKYQLFQWVQYSPEYAGILTLCWFISGLAFASGFLFRVTALLCTVLTVYQFVISAEEYLNHEYMEIIFLFLLSLGPSHHRLSIDNLIWRYSGVAPRFHLLTLKIQTEIILVYAGLVKLGYDWLHLQPLSNWLNAKEHLFFLGAMWGQEWMVAAGAYGIILLHVFGAPLLFFRKTRAWVFCFYVPFHVINSLIFRIDIFPWMTIAATTLFFEPDWPRRICAGITEKFRKSAARIHNIDERALAMTLPKRIDSILIIFFAGWLFLQAVIPLRPLLYPGPVNWTGEGHMFSWRMMLTQKTCPLLVFVLNDADEQFFVVPDTLALVSKYRLRLGCRDPDFILQLAHQIKDRYIRLLKLPDETRIRAVVMKSINYRTASLYTDPAINLGKEKLSLKHYSWIQANQKLNPLPPPFQKHDKRSEVISLDDLFQLPDIKADYDCKPLSSFNEKEGQGIYCKRKLQ